MNEPNGKESEVQQVPEAVVQTRKRQFSIVWLVPVVALLIGGWLAYKALSEKGPTVTLTFRTAEGLEAGKTKIKYKNVEVGQVETINLSEDLTHVIVTAEMVHGADPYLTEDTRFWVVRARVTAGEVTGLGTIFSGAYIGMDPGEDGVPKRDFKGLEIPPVVTEDLPGNHFILRSERLGSLDIGSPIYYRQIKVGQIVSYKLEGDNKTIRFKAFVNAPHHELVYKNTKFWNASGLDVRLDANGIKIQTESLVTLIGGGVAFDLPASQKPGPPVPANYAFTLYQNREDIQEKTQAQLNHWILQFKGSVRGLSKGAPVELRGIKFGEVIDIKAKFDEENMEPLILVYIATDPEVFVEIADPNKTARGQLNTLVAKGLRAQLQTGSLLTGQLFVDIDFHPDAPPAIVKYEREYPEIPTIPAPMEMITASVTQLLNKIEKLPLEEIAGSLRNTMQGAERLITSKELQQSVGELRAMLENTRKITADVNTTITPELYSALSQLNNTLQQSQKTMVEVGDSVNQNSPLYRELVRAMKELADAAQSIRTMADYLERHPDALIYGKGRKQ
jgi:paraquat-inducible protein B